MRTIIEHWPQIPVWVAAPVCVGGGLAALRWFFKRIGAW